MRQFRNETKLGLVIFWAILIFIFGVLYLSGYEFRGDYYKMKILFTNATGLSKDDPIMIMGLSVGKVERLSLNKNVVEAEISINRSVQLPEDSEFMIRTLNLMGEKYVAVTLGKSENFARPGDVLPGMTELDMGDVAQMVNPLNERISKFLDQMNELTNKETSDGLKRTLNEVSEFTQSLRENLDQQMEHMLELTKEMRLTFSRLDSITVEEKGQVKNILASFQNTTDSLKMAISTFNEMTKSAGSIMEKIDSGEGSLGRLVNDDAMIRKMEALTTHADSFIVDFMKHPKKYVHLSIF